MSKVFRVQIEKPATNDACTTGKLFVRAHSLVSSQPQKRDSTPTAFCLVMARCSPPTDLKSSGPSLFDESDH